MGATMGVTVEAIRQLRGQTGAGVMECKRALEKAGGDAEQAAALLKEQGLLQVKKREDRETREGRVFLRVGDTKAVLLRLACETDFVARNAVFIRLGEECLALAFDRELSESSGILLEPLTVRIQETATRIRENIVLHDLKTLPAGPGEKLTGYVHGEGRIGAVIALRAPEEAAWDHPAVRGLGNDLALHVAASAPLFLSRAVVDPGYLTAVEQEYRADALTLGKAGHPRGAPLAESAASSPHEPRYKENLLEAIVQGKLKTHLAQVCLLEQPYLKDESSTVEDVVAIARAASGFDVRVSGFLYDRVGD